MSLILNGIQSAASILRTNVIPVRFIHPTFSRFYKTNDVKNATTVDAATFSKDRSKVIPVETSIKYMQSDAYKEAYGDYPVWKFYRRNYKGHYPPRKTRKTCIRNNLIATGSPCPICRDEYLVVDYRNVDLLKQFISEFSGAVLDSNKTGLCRKAHNNLLVAILQAKDYGLLTFDVPFRHYDYSEWIKYESDIPPKLLRKLQRKNE